MQKVVLIIAPEMFRDEEYAEPRRVLEKAGYKVITASSELGQAKGRFGLTAKIDLTLDQLKAEDYEAILFIGGPGSRQFHHNPIAHALILKGVKYGKVIGAICAAVTTLANANVLKGKKVTSFPDEKAQIVAQGAIHTGQELEIDGKIITADGPQTAKAWGEAIAAALGNN